MVYFRKSYCKSSLCMHGEKIHAYGMHKLEQFCAQCGLAVYIKLCIRRYLDKKSTIILTHAFVTSRLDNFNSLLGNIPQKDTSRLQRIQNISARINARTSRTASTSHILQSLHWLPVDKRIKFKILLITYKALHGLAPVYISELLQRYQQRRTLCSQSHFLLQVPSARTQYYGARSFAFTAPTLWNALPLQL